jgi:hypothetical protein
MATTHTPTDDDLLRLPHDGHRYEVVDGELDGADVVPGFRCGLGLILGPRA